MSADNPYPLPPPRLVAALCMQAAWHDDLDDEVRLRLEHAADTIDGLLDRLVKLAKQLEISEASR